MPLRELAIQRMQYQPMVWMLSVRGWNYCEARTLQFMMYRELCWVVFTQSKIVLSITFTFRDWLIIAVLLSIEDKSK